MNKKIVIKFIGYILIFSLFIIGCAQFSWSANIDLSRENIDGVRPGLKYDLYVLRTLIATETKIENRDSGRDFIYMSQSFNVTIHINNLNQVESIAGQANDSSKIRTSKKIGKGSSLSEIEQAYGTTCEVKKVLGNGDTTVSYTDKSNNLELGFILDDKNIVKSVCLSTV